MPVHAEQKGNIVVFTIDRPEAQNALNPDILTEVKTLVHKYSSVQDARLIIITGAGEKAFCAGADIGKMKDYSPSEAEEFARLGHETMNAIASSDLISIAAINGFALGGGLELALACDIRVASKNAKMGLPETGLGLIPGFGGTQRLPRIVGKGIGVELILTGEMISAERAYQLGLVNHLYETGEALSSAIELAEKLLTNRAPNAQKIARWLAKSGLDQPLSAGLEREINAFAEIFAGPEPRTGLTAFLEKRKPDY